MQRFGDQVTDGCLSISEHTLKSMFALALLGDQIEVKTDGLCAP